MRIVYVPQERHVLAYKKALDEGNERVADRIYRGLVAIEGYEYASVVRWEAVKRQRRVA